MIRFAPYLEMGRPGSVPFVSHRPGAYGCLLLCGVRAVEDWSVGAF